MVRIRQAADEIFRRNEEEKRQRKREDAVDLKNFHGDQIVGFRFQSTALCWLLLRYVGCSFITTNNKTLKSLTHL